MTNNLQLKWIKIPEKFPKVPIDEEFIQRVESLAEKCFENRRYQEVYRLHNEWYNHVNNILGYIADFCFTTDLNLNKHEWTIIIAAAILHDIGKSLPYLHPLIDDKKIFDDTFVLKNLEEAHHVISFIVLKTIADEKSFDDLADLLKENNLNLKDGYQEQKEHYFHLQDLISNFFPKEEKPKNIEDWGKYLHCAAWISLQHKTMNDKLFHIFKPVLKNYLEEVMGTLDNETYEKKAPDFYGKDIKGNQKIEKLNIEFLKDNPEKGCPDRFSILSALLQLGDKLDITKARIREDRLYFEVLLDDLAEEKEFLQQINIQKQYIIGAKSLIRWFQYYYVHEIEIEKQPPNNNNHEKDSDISQKQCNNERETGINITIHYRYPECLRDDFLFIRLQLEKDFEDLQILSVLESALQEKKHDEDYRVNLLRSENKKNDNDGNKKPQRIIGLQRRSERLVFCLEKVCNTIRTIREYKADMEIKLQCLLGLSTNVVEVILSLFMSVGGKKCISNKYDFLNTVKQKFPNSNWNASDPSVNCLEEIYIIIKSIWENEEYIKKKLQGCLALTDENVADIFSCMGSQNGNPTLEKCALFKRVKEIFQKDAGKASHPDWDDISIKLSENIRYLLCRDKKSNINKKTEDYRSELTDENKVMLSLSPQARIGLNEWKEEAAKESKKVQQGKLFYPPDSKTRFIPVSLDVAILLNLFRHLRDESLTVEDISNISGLDHGRILKYCGWLEHEQYLLLDDKKETYKINLDPAKYSIVEKVLRDFDSRRSEMVSKIRDIDRFGKPLALYSELNNERIKTNIKGLDRILCPFEVEKMWGLPLRKSILLVGPPGSGKTTLALDIIRQVRLQRLPEEIALYLTFSGDIQRLRDDFKSLGWEYHDIAACVRSLSTLQGKTYLTDPDKFFKHLLNILDEFSPDLVAIDNLGYFLRLVPPEFCREIFNRLIKVLTVRGITSILIGDDIPNGIGFECFDTDGVICLHYKDGKRELEITKMRGRDFAGGRHPFKIKGISEEDRGKPEELDEPIIEIFPNIQMHLEVAHRKKKEEDSKKEEEKKVLKSGIKGLDDLLPVVIEGKKDTGFEQGEIILVLGSPGAGKTVSGLHFLAEGDHHNEKFFWVSFESDLDGLYLATRSFDDKTSIKSLYKKMKEKDEEKESKEKMFHFFPPAQLNPDELVNFLLNSCKGEEKEGKVEENGDKKTETKKLQRLVLDSVNDIEQAFPTDMAFRSFMTSLVQLLREEKVTVMFLYRTRSFFGKAEDIGRTLASVVDTIICLKVLEIQNAVQKGLFLLKVRGREHKSNLLSIDFKDEEGMSVLDRGWTMSGLISGESGEIKEPRVSVKLFFENRNEFLINALIVSEYNRRFKGGQTNFVHVRKPQIYSEFWSFRGSSGAGHANVRVVSLCDYWAAHFRNQTKLCELEEYVNIPTIQLVGREEFWRRCATYSFKKHAFEIFSIPNYVDIGVLAFHKDITQLNKFWEIVSPDDKPNENNVRQKLSELAWNDLDPREINHKYPGLISKIIGEMESGNKDPKNANNTPRYLFAMPALEEKASFVSFFLEVYWSFGGVIFDFRDLFNSYANACNDLLSETNKNKTVNIENLLFFKTQAIDLKGTMAFIAEILMLIPEQILNQGIQYMNSKYPNFVGDVCRCGEILLDKAVEKLKPAEKSLLKPGSRSAWDNLANPILSFFPGREKEVGEFLSKLSKKLKKDKIWNKKWLNVNGEEVKNLLTELNSVQEKIKTILKPTQDNKNEDKEHLLIILYFVVSRVITDRDRYQMLLNWRFKEKKDAEILSNKEGIIQINDKNSAAVETFEFLFQLVNSGIAPNPHRGDFTDQAYLARKWSGDIAPRPEVPAKEELFKSLDLNAPPDAYDNATRVKKENGNSSKSPYGIAPLPLYERKTENGDGVPEGKWSYAVMGLWSLGIIKPALSPEIAWIFIDALTEDKFVELRAKKGLGLPAKASAYQRESIRKEQPDIYGTTDDKGNIIKKGIVQYYDLAMQDKPKKEESGSKNQKDTTVHRRTRERVSIPYYYQIEEFLIKELSRFFEPSFFEILGGKGNDETKKKKERQKLIGTVLQRIHNRIKNFLITQFKLVDEKTGTEEKPGD